MSAGMDAALMAALNDPDGHALVQAIHNRKAESGLPGFDGGQNTLPEADSSQKEPAKEQHPHEDAGHAALAADHDRQESADSGNEQASRDESGTRTLGLAIPHVFHGPSITQPETTA